MRRGHFSLRCYDLNLINRHYRSFALLFALLFSYALHADPPSVLLEHAKLSDRDEPMLGAAINAPRSDSETGLFSLQLEIRRAQALYETRRFSDAAQIFDRIYQQMRASYPARIDTYLAVIDYLARSISQQGLTDNVVSLMEQRHAIIAEHYHSEGYLFASSLARVAESRYRQGDRQLAVQLTNQAMALYQQLNPVPEDEYALARKNLIQYSVAAFSPKMLPRDLSSFYTQCELLGEWDDSSRIDSLLAGFTEVGVDYQPEGDWQAFFGALLNPVDHDGNIYSRRVFIADAAVSQREHVCLVPSIERTVNWSGGQ